MSAPLPRSFSSSRELRAQLTVLAVLYSHGDGDVATLLFCSSQGDCERRLDPLHLVDKLDPELVMMDCRIETRNIKNKTMCTLSWLEYFFQGTIQFILCD